MFTRVSGLLWVSTTGAGFLIAHVRNSLWSPLRSRFFVYYFDFQVVYLSLLSFRHYSVTFFVGFPHFVVIFVLFLLLVAKPINSLFKRVSVKDILSYFLPLICGGRGFIDCMRRPLISIFASTNSSSSFFANCFYRCAYLWVFSSSWVPWFFVETCSFN